MGCNRKMHLMVACVVAMLPAARAIAFSPDAVGCDVEHKAIVSVKRDSLLSLQWAVMVDCEHPERPARMVLLSDNAAVAGGIKGAVEVRSVSVEPVAPVLVRAGETVRLWSQDGVTRIETTGVAQESGAAGKQIRVRLLREGMNRMRRRDF
jgi:Chaperone for flagella basal body P-ring formation